MSLKKRAEPLRITSPGNKKLNRSTSGVILHLKCPLIDNGKGPASHYLRIMHQPTELVNPCSQFLETKESRKSLPSLI